MGPLTWMRNLRARRLAGPLPAWKPRPDAGGDHNGHVVQFYVGDFPAGTVAGFLREGIAKGEVCLVIATPAHVKAIDALLDRPGKCVYLDAGETLARFMVDGRPDRQRFHDTVGDLVQQAAEAGNGPVRAFGEMVVLLCERGEPEAARQLEALWNEVGERHHVRLLCSYPAHAVGGRNKGFAAPLRDAHSHAIA